MYTSWCHLHVYFKFLRILENAIACALFIFWTPCTVSALWLIHQMAAHIICSYSDHQRSPLFTAWLLVLYAAFNATISAAVTCSCSFHDGSLWNIDTIWRPCGVIWQSLALSFMRLITGPHNGLPDIIHGRTPHNYLCSSLLASWHICGHGIGNRCIITRVVNVQLLLICVVPQEFTFWCPLLIVDQPRYYWLYEWRLGLWMDTEFMNEQVYEWTLVLWMEARFVDKSNEWFMCQ